MPTLINSSFFVRNINVPNLDDAGPLEKINLFIQRYEQQFLLRVFGYPLYKAFTAETNFLIQSHIIGGYLRNDEQIKVGITTGFEIGLNNFVFDGTSGKPDYRGFVIVPSELNGRGILILGLDYSWNLTTGEFVLLQANDVFLPNQVYNIHFEPAGFVLQNNPTGGETTDRMFRLLYGSEFTDCDGRLNYWKGLIHDIDQSPIADYVYYYLQESDSTQKTGVNTSIQKAENAITMPVYFRMINAWAEMSDEVMILIHFLWNFKDINDNRIFPEFNSKDYCYSRTNFRKNIYW